MGASFSIDRDHRVVRLRYEGEIAFAEWRSALVDAITHPEYEKGFGFLGDRREEALPSVDFIRATAWFMEDHQRELGGTRWAMVASDATSYGMMRMGQALMDGVVNVEIFKEMRAAEAWLLDTDPRLGRRAAS